MTESARIKRNSIFSFLSMASRLVANVIVFWLIARIYGPEQFGIFTFAHTTATLLILLGDFGFDLLLTTEIAKDRSNALKTFQDIFSLKIVFTLLAFSIMWIFTFWENMPPETKITLWIFSFFLLFTTLTNFSISLIKGFEKFSYETVISIIMNLSLIIFIVIFAINKSSIQILAFVFAITRIFGFLLSLYFSKRVLPQISFRIKFSKDKSLHKKVFVFGLNLLFTNLFFQLDTILLSVFKGNEAVGFYQAVFKLIILPLMIPDVLNFTLLPVLSRLFVSEPLRAKKISLLMNKILVLFSVPITLILFLFPDQIINIIYGRDLYSQSIPVLRIFAFNIFVRFAFESFALILTTTDRQIVRMYTVIIATIINVILNLILIPKFSLIGAASVSLVTIIFVYFIYALNSMSLFKEWFMNLKTVLLFISGISIGVLIYTLKMNLFVGIPVILTLFSAFGVLYYLTSEERDVLFSMDFLNFSKIKKS